MAAPGPSHDPGDFLVVGIGASAGGLEACSKLIDVLPAKTGMAFILVQHLDPTHESMLADLLSTHTAMPVSQATDGMPIEPEHFYVIPPGTYLSVAAGALHLSLPQARHGARLPFDFLLHSMAEALGRRAACVILSGTGADGSLGLQAVRDKGGLVIAQDPAEAGFDGMPQSAIATGLVELVLPVAGMPAALADHARRVASARGDHDIAPDDRVADRLPEIIDLLRAKTAHDFRLYKPGTLQRRIERRMAMAAIPPGDVAAYLNLLKGDSGELDRLAKDLLINVTSFFRDPDVFDLLAAKIIPDMVRGRGHDHPIRIWIAGCSTGEETYSLAMLFCEEIGKASLDVKLQVFASDVDPDAIAQAREGLYPDTIAADVSAARLARFFSKEDQGFRVLPDLRATVVFTVQDVLADPPFSRLYMVSCRNLLIYLRPEAQAKVVSIFDFALGQGGILLLGNSETLGPSDARFEVVSKSARIYRHAGRSRPGTVDYAILTGDGVRLPPRQRTIQTPSRQAALAELCRRLVLDNYAPAAVLINSKQECLFSLGPTDRYLRVPPGHPSQDLLSMVRDSLRTKLRAAIHQAGRENARIVSAGGRTTYDGSPQAFSIAVEPVLYEGEALLLICFIDDPKPEAARIRAAMPAEASQIAQLEQELEATRAELQGAIRNLELSSEEQKAINEEALSVNEEYQSTNEELLTSKEELQSLNEELTALNSQLQETLERQRTTANDLQNVLYSTNVATIFLDSNLNIRFFTPATKAIFNIIPTDIGRPLADFSSLAIDTALLTDAAVVLRDLAPLEREIEARGGAWFLRRILPYRTPDHKVEGVVITFVNITERRKAADALAAAKREADLANTAKSRFLAAASHDLRQPLQTLALVEGLLSKTVEGDAARKHLALLAPTLAAMTGMLNTLLDINQIDTGTVHAQVTDFPIGDLLNRLREEFSYHAQVQGLTLHVVSSKASIRSDARLLEQMIRNLLANAIKYTKRGKVLLGCRRHDGRLSIEIWDTGVGIADRELKAIFDEYHQVDNPARERSRGLGLGLSIVQRLGTLLGHPVLVRSKLGKGSVFSIDVDVPPGGHTADPAGAVAETAAPVGAHRTGAILVIEDDPDVRKLLEMLLNDEGYQTAVAADAVAALDLVAQGTIRPDILLADYNVPSGMNGLQAAARLRATQHRETPVIILTGDTSAATQHDIAAQNCIYLQKPVMPRELTQIIQRLLGTPMLALPAARKRSRPAGGDAQPVVFIVDDDDQLRAGIRDVLEEAGRTIEDYDSSEAFLASFRPGGEACLLIDAYLPGMDGFELLQRLRDDGHSLPSIMITGNSDVNMAVRAMKAGVVDFIEKPISRADLLAGVERALEQSRDSGKLTAWREAAAAQLAGLTVRQRQIMEMVLAGQPSKNIAADLGISQRTVENHRAAIMKRTGVRSLPALARLALAVASGPPVEPAL